jgi:hypothetical protein
MKSGAGETLDHFQHQALPDAIHELWIATQVR